MAPFGSNLPQSFAPKPCEPGHPCLRAAFDGLAADESGLCVQPPRRLRPRVIGPRGDLGEPVEVLLLEHVGVAVVKVRGHELLVVHAELLAGRRSFWIAFSMNSTCLLHDGLVSVQGLDDLSLGRFREVVLHAADPDVRGVDSLSAGDVHDVLPDLPHLLDPDRGRKCRVRVLDEVRQNKQLVERVAVKPVAHVAQVLQDDAVLWRHYAERPVDASVEALAWVIGQMPQNRDDATGANSIGFPVINFSNPLTGVMLR